MTVEIAIIVIAISLYFLVNISYLGQINSVLKQAYAKSYKFFFVANFLIFNLIIFLSFYLGAFYYG